MRRVAGRDGLGAATVSSVAEEAGLQRTLVFHYFRDRGSLVSAFIEDAVGAYGDAQLLAGPGEISERVDRAFSGGFYTREEDLALWQELVSLAARDGDVRSSLRSLWTERWLPRIEEQLREAFPAAPEATVGAVAYALAGLVEAHWAFAVQGVGGRLRARQARAAGRALLATLGG